MIRVALAVANLEQSRSFYGDVLGLTEVYSEGDISEGNAHLFVGQPPGSSIRYATLKAPGPAFGMVGLFELSKPQPPPLQRPAAGMSLGEACLVFYCAALDPIETKLRSRGSSIICPATPIVIRDRIKQREMVFRDPDAVLINLIEWDATRPERPELWKGNAPDVGG